MTATTWSNFWGGTGYSLLNNRSHAAFKVFTWLRKRSVLADRANEVAIIAATPAQTGTNTRQQLKAVADGLLNGGSRPLESIVTTSRTASATSPASPLKKSTTIATRPSYPGDRSGNGKGALT